MVFKDVVFHINNLLASHLDFIKKAFSDNGIPSSSRLLAIPHTIAAIFVLIYISIHTGHFPGLDEATGLAGFATAPYVVNRASNMFGGQKKDRDGGGSDNTNPPPAPQV